jgi:hypothetical protein
MKKNLFYIFSAFLVAVLFDVSAGFAQESRRTVSDAASMYVVSAKAGGVNYIEGKVTVARKFGKSGYLLRGDTLEIGDRVSTGADEKAEILLNPGSFVRLAENSSFEFTTTSFEDLQLKLNRGSAMFEVITDNNFSFAVNTPNARFYVVQTGVYRIDVLNDGTDKIEVWKGSAQIGDANNATLIKGGKQAVVKNGEVSIAKFDRDDKDALEIFSKARAKELAKVNAKLQSADVRTSLMSSFYQTRWSLYNSYGLWVYSPFYNSYCFLPFGYGWSSPYGYYYPRDIWYYNLPPVIYNPQPPTTTTPTPRLGTTARGRERDSENSREGQPSVKPIPPYARIQAEIGRQPDVTDRPTYTPSFPSSSPSSAPAAPPPTLSPVGLPAKRDN